MPIEIHCECGHEVHVADEMAGRKGRCPSCDTVIEVPAPEDGNGAPGDGGAEARPGRGVEAGDGRGRGAKAEDRAAGRRTTGRRAAGRRAVSARVASHPVPVDESDVSNRVTISLAGFLGLVAFLSLLLFAGTGVYTGVTAFRGPEHFHGPLGLFAEFGDAVAENRWVVGTGFILGGTLVGILTFVVFTAAAQVLRIVVSVERSLARIADHLEGRD